MLEVIRLDEYITSEGETFDSIAYELYDNEFLASELIAFNPWYASTLIFHSGIILIVPVYNQTEIANDLPPWRTEVSL